MDVEQERKNIVFLSSSYVNLAHLFAKNNTDIDVFLILDRKFPQDFEDYNLDNFYIYTFDKNKLYDKNIKSYFETLGVFVSEFEPDFVVCSNFSKLLPNSFLDFLKFTNSKLKVFNLHNADLRILDENKMMRFMGLNADVKQFLDEAMIITTIHLIENSEMDTGKQLAYSHETTLKELKQKSLINKKEDMLNLRLRNVVLSYHERTKVLKLLRKVIDKF